MSPARRLRRKAEEWLLHTDAGAAAILLGVFLACNGYVYGWDDQHLEIPLLKALIDPTLYPGDYYVASLKTHFASLFYPLLARLITIDLIPPVYLILYLVSRFGLFYGMFRIWRRIGGDRLSAFFCVLSVLLIGRVEEFLYRTFSHQELALALVFIGLAFFYERRRVVAAGLFGIAANIHALYSLFPMVYLLTEILFFAPRRGRGRRFFEAAAVFTICSLPVLWFIWRRLLADEAAPATGQWLDLYQLACPQNFPLLNASFASVWADKGLFWERIRPYVFPAVLTGLQAGFHGTFREDRRTHAVLAAGAALLAAAFVFSYIIPWRLAVDLNLVRNIQYLRFVLVGYTGLAVFRWCGRVPRIAAVLLVWLFALFRLGGDIALTAAVGMGVSMGFLATPVRSRRRIAWGLGLAAVMVILGVLLFHVRYSAATWTTLAAVAVFTGGWASLRGRATEGRRFAVGLFTIVFLSFFTHGVWYHLRRLTIERTAGGFWQLQRNWLDMQRYVRTHTPKQALLLVPYDMEMGGFRIFSERSIVLSYRDCGVIGFDYRAAEEWRRRLDDVRAFQVLAREPTLPAIRKAVVDYKVNDIVFMGYMDPGETPLWEPVYRNETFVLYRVKVNPVSSGTRTSAAVEQEGSSVLRFHRGLL